MFQTLSFSIIVAFDTFILDFTETTSSQIWVTLYLPSPSQSLLNKLVKALIIREPCWIIVQGIIISWLIISRDNLTDSLFRLLSSVICSRKYILLACSGSFNTVFGLDYLLSFRLSSVWITLFWWRMRPSFLPFL